MLGFHYLLGAEYERKKQKLQQELQMDYKRYIDQKRDSTVRVNNSSQYHSLSLPIADRASDKKKLRDERNREYNLFLQEQTKSRRRGQLSLASQPEKPYNFELSHKFPQDPSPPGSYTERPTSRRDAATITDIVKTKKGRKTWDIGHQRRQAFLSRPESYHSSDDKLSMDSEEEMELSHMRKRNELRHKSTHIKEDKYSRAERARVDIKHDEVNQSKSNNDHNLNSETQHKQGKGKIEERLRPTFPAIRNNTVFITGLVIGQTEEQEALQRKKEQYKQALLNQIAEQRENKRKEKILELKEAATGATVPNKPDRHHNFEGRKSGVSGNPDTGNTFAKENVGLKHFPDSNFKIGHREPPERPKIAFLSPTLEENRSLQNIPNHDSYSPDASFDEYKKDFSQMIGDVATKVISGFPPPLPPRVENSYKTPYDDAYYYYASRHPLDPMLSHNQRNTKYKPEGGQEFETRTFPQQRPDFGQRITVFPHRHLSSESEQRRENTLIYQEALKQQMKDIEECRRRERKERELYDAKIAAEMMSYNPWGRAGGGAPNKDQSGNLITNLDQMHRTNEETYRKYHITNSLGFIGGGTPRPRLRPSLPDLGHLGYSDAEHSQRQDRYKEELMQQIKADRQKQAEQREQQRIMEEKDEKRLAEERAQLLKEYEEEARRNQMKMQRKEDYEVMIYENKSHLQKTYKSDKDRKRPESNKQDRLPTRDRTTYESPEQRAPSPPIPTLRQKPSNTNDPGPSSVRSQLSSKTQEHEEAAQSHTEQTLVQAQQQQDDQQEIITELAALRAFLEKEKKHVESKLMRTDPANEHYPPLARHKTQTGQERRGTAEPRQKERVLSPTQKPHSTQENMRNFREFNQLKYRDTPSREELLYDYPDPPTNAPNLDLQQQALLREQQRRLRLMRRDTENVLEQEDLPSSVRVRTRHVHRNSVLPSDTAFLDVYSCEDDFFPQPSVKSQRRSSHRRRHNYEEEAVPVDQINGFESDAPPKSSDTFINQARYSGRHRRRSENQCGDEVDILSLRSTLSARERPCSMGTVATEPWLRTSTAEPEHLGYRRTGRRQRAQL